MSASAPRLVSLADHPRAGPAIRRAKALGGLGGFGLMALAGVIAGLPAADVLLRALAGGIGGHLVLWVVSIALWQRLLRAEARAAALRARERRQAGAAQ